MIEAKDQLDKDTENAEKACLCLEGGELTEKDFMTLIRNNTESYRGEVISALADYEIKLQEGPITTWLIETSFASNDPHLIFLCAYAIKICCPQEAVDRYEKRVMKEADEIERRQSRVKTIQQAMKRADF